MIEETKLKDALKSVGCNSGDVNATIFYAWLKRNNESDKLAEISNSKVMLIQKATEFKEEYQQ